LQFEQTVKFRETDREREGERERERQTERGRGREGGRERDAVHYLWQTKQISVLSYLKRNIPGIPACDACN
jgi:hypothetical protein